MTVQQALFGGAGVPRFDPGLPTLRRLELDQGAWVDYAPGWVAGHEVLMEHLIRTIRWRSERRWMYEREVDVPRLYAELPQDGDGHPVIQEIAAALSARYGTAFPNVTLGYYRDGKDSVAWHGDQVARNLPESLVATVSLGEPRRFLLKPTQGGRSQAFQLGWGDLIVMGGTCQRTWRHAIPKVAHAGPRIAVMLRPTFYRRRPAAVRIP